MSRHNIPAFDKRYEIVVGWDWPMRTYFAQVHDNEATEDENLVPIWIGTSFDEILTPEELVKPIAPYGALQDNVIAILHADRGLTLGA
ncbi:hypothetical protein [Acidocella facilis]|uniref:hypothetical protein n=1 Tax=Acidocella facilis TaxID=525 RepID=UPI001F21F64F|nr:hypothetical protein [Acidocella facilis]